MTTERDELGKTLPRTGQVAGPTDGARHVLPTQLEQFLFGWRVEQNAIGLVATGDRPPTDLLARLYRVANDPVIRQNAEAFAARYRNFDQQHVVGNIVQRIGALAGDVR